MKGKNSLEDYFRIYLYPLKTNKKDRDVYYFLKKLGRKQTEFIVALVSCFLNNTDIANNQDLSSREIENIIEYANRFFDNKGPLNPISSINSLNENKISMHQQYLSTDVSKSEKNIISDEDTEDLENISSDTTDFYNTDSTISSCDIMENTDAIMSAFDV